MFAITVQECLLLLALLLLFFGRKLPEVGRSLGKSVVEFKKGVRGLEQGDGEGVPELVRRRATVRYYSRMNPWRMVPLLVVLSEDEIRRAALRRVGQDASGPFEVAAGLAVVVEPAFPGCTCYPARQEVRIGPEPAEARFWVVPQVLGKVHDARVRVWQGERLLAELSPETRVVRQTAAVVMGACSLVLPLAYAVLRHFRLDLESQFEDGFQLYGWLWRSVWQGLTPGGLFLVLAVMTGLLFWWARPRRRELFWEIEPAREPQANGVRAGEALAAIPR